MKRFLSILLFAVAPVACLGLSAAHPSAPSAVAAAGIDSPPEQPPAPCEEIPPVALLRVMTLNAAHGRGLAFHQALETSETLHDNLNRIGAVVAREAPDVVALQEIDGPSAWTGAFDQVGLLGEHAGYPHSFRGTHGTPMGPIELDYGTALLARLPLWQSQSRVFDASWRDNKGFVVARVAAPGLDGLEVDVASVHLDFLRSSVRQRQIDTLVATLAQRQRPLIVVGDFNCDWQETTCLPELSRRLGLKAHAPHNSRPTFPADAPDRRLDWILISQELRFVSYRTLGDEISDHRAVIAEVAPL